MKKITLGIAAMLSISAALAAGDEFRVVQYGQGTSVTYLQPSSGPTTVALYRNHRGVRRVTQEEQATRMEQVQAGNGAPVSYLATER